jgi:hypothetical protein
LASYRRESEYALPRLRRPFNHSRRSAQRATAQVEADSDHNVAFLHRLTAWIEFSSIIQEEIVEILSTTPELGTGAS